MEEFIHQTEFFSYFYVVQGIHEAIENDFLDEQSLSLLNPYMVSNS